MTAEPGQDGGFVFFADESFSGAVARWADQIALERMRDVTWAAGVEWGHRQLASCASGEQIRALAAEMEVDANELLIRALPIIQDGAGSRRLHRFRGLSVSSALIEKRIRRVSPKALQIAPYHRALWDLRLFPCCLETGDILIDSCDNPRCVGSKLGWRHTRGIDVCDHCMADLKEAHTPRFAPELTQRLRVIAKLLNPEERPQLLGRLPDRIAANNGQVAFDLLIRLLPVVDPDLKSFWARLHRADPFKLAEAVTTAWDIVCKWPAGFKELISQRIARRDGIHLDGNRGETISFLNGKRMGSASTELADIAAEVREEMQVGGKNAESGSGRSMAIKPAAKLLALGTAEVAQLRREGILQVRPGIDTRGRLQPMFCRNEIQEIAEGISHRVGVHAVAWQLGISQNGVQQLIDEGHLRTIEHPFFLIRYGLPQIRIASVQHFLNEIEQAQSDGQIDSEVTLSIAIKVVGACLKPWGAVFGALLDGGIPFRIKPGPTPLVRRIFIGRKNLTKISALACSARAPDILISKSDAFEILNVGPKEGTAVFADNPTAKGSKAKLLSVRSVIEQGLRHITSTELGLRRGVSTQKAYNDLLRSGVPMLSPAGFCRTTAEATFFPSSN